MQETLKTIKKGLLFSMLLSFLHTNVFATNPSRNTVKQDPIVTSNQEVSSTTQNKSLEETNTLTPQEAHKDGKFTLSNTGSWSILCMSLFAISGMRMVYNQAQGSIFVLSFSIVILGGIGAILPFVVRLFVSDCASFCYRNSIIYKKIASFAFEENEKDHEAYQLAKLLLIVSGFSIGLIVGAMLPIMLQQNQARQQGHGIGSSSATASLLCGLGGGLLGSIIVPGFMIIAMWIIHLPGVTISPCVEFIINYLFPPQEESYSEEDDEASQESSL